MAEVLGVVAVAASLVSFSSSTLLLVKDFVKSIETVKQLEREVIVLQHILTEYGQIVQKVTPLPDSMVACISMCLEKENDLLILLSHLTALSRKKIGRFLVTMKEPELMTTYNAFRDSILLLRDLSAEYINYLIELHYIKLTLDQFTHESSAYPNDVSNPISTHERLANPISQNSDGSTWL